MTGPQQALLLLSISAVLTAVLGVGIMVWGWPFWLLPAVFWVTAPPVVLIVERLGNKRTPSDHGALRGRRPHRPAGTH